MTILIADDDPTSRLILRAALEKDGHEVVAAENGAQAVSLYAAMKRPALIILDWEMPSLSGLDVIEQVNDVQAVDNPYIILLTARTEEGDLAEALGRGAHDFIKKPLDLRELRARVAVGVRTVQLQNRLIETREELLYLSRHDPLTKVYNRRAILDQLESELSRSQRVGTILYAAMLDLDHFKKINDTWGHGAGDQVLMAFADAVRSELRKYDSFGRIGGEEFLLLIPADKPLEINLFERIRQAVRHLTFPFAPPDFMVTVSIGVCLVTPGSSSSSVLEWVDHALYQAKDGGRDRVVPFTHPNGSTLP